MLGEAEQESTGSEGKGRIRARERASLEVRRMGSDRLGFQFSYVTHQPMSLESWMLLL